MGRVSGKRDCTGRQAVAVARFPRASDFHIWLFGIVGLRPPHAHASETRARYRGRLYSHK